MFWSLLWWHPWSLDSKLGASLGRRRALSEASNLLEEFWGICRLTAWIPAWERHNHMMWGPSTKLSEHQQFPDRALSIRCILVVLSHVHVPTWYIPGSPWKGTAITACALQHGVVQVLNRLKWPRARIYRIPPNYIRRFTYLPMAHVSSEPPVWLHQRWWIPPQHSPGSLRPNNTVHIRTN